MQRDRRKEKDSVAVSQCRRVARFNKCSSIQAKECEKRGRIAMTGEASVARGR